MPTFKHSIVAGVASICILGCATAADMTGSQIQSLISGKTGYVQTGAASVTGRIGEGVIYWGADGNSLYKTPQGPIWHGIWSIKGNLYCADYKEGSKRPCMKVEKQGDTARFIDTESGQLRIAVVKTAPGNAENLK